MKITQICATGFVLLTVLYGFSHISGVGVHGMLRGIVMVIDHFV